MPQKSADAFRTISEVADWLDTPAHVLRFWESKFSQVKPVKRAGGRRYYRPADMQLLGGIKKLLHDDGMTIKGAQKLLRENGIRYVAALSPPLEDELEQFVSHPAPGAHVPPLEVPKASLRIAEDAEPETAEVVPFSARSAPTDAELDQALRDEMEADNALRPAPAEPANPNSEPAAAPPAPSHAAPSPADQAAPSQPPAATDPAPAEAPAADPTPDAAAAEPQPVDAAPATETATSDNGAEVAPEPASAEPVAATPAAGKPTIAEPAIAEPADEKAPELELEAAPESAAVEPAQSTPPMAEDVAQSAPEEAAAQVSEGDGSANDAVNAPKVADVTVPADITETDVTPPASVLSKLADAPDVTQQRATLRPLVARLSALKDKMSASRRS